MNREQFDLWVTEHYADLVSVARARTRNADDAEQDVQEALRRMLSANPVGRAPADREDTPRSEFPNQPWTWAVLNIRTSAKERRAADINRQQANADAEQIFAGSTLSQSVDALELVGRPQGIARWRYQQLRDESLFQAAWLEDERDAFRRAMRRRHHFGEPGVSYVQFGQEVSA